MKAWALPPDGATRPLPWVQPVFVWGARPTTKCLDGTHRACRGGFWRPDEVYIDVRTGKRYLMSPGPCSCKCHDGWVLEKFLRREELPE